jgi:hypothetical protein
VRTVEVFASLEQPGRLRTTIAARPAEVPGIDEEFIFDDHRYQVAWTSPIADVPRWLTLEPGEGAFELYLDWLDA